jgi:hypothetical protein
MLITQRSVTMESETKLDINSIPFLKTINKDNKKTDKLKVTIITKL